jgi:transposase InsO family protein
MPAFLNPFSFFLACLAGWLNQHQQIVIDYLTEENRVLREQIGHRRLHFTDDQRRRLAVRAKELSRSALTQVANIVTPETLLAWHRHFDQIAATDFFTVEVWTFKGLQRFVVLFFIELSSRRVQLGGIAECPNGLWMEQVGRNITDCEEGILKKKRYLIHDRDPLYTTQFIRILAESGIDSVKLPPRSPNLNAFAERFVRSIKEDCLERMILFGEDSLRTAVREYLVYYHAERNHQGLDNQLIAPVTTERKAHGTVQRRQQLGGSLN